MIEVPRIVAHRGSSGRAPENTLLAMRLAIREDGADGLELDLQRTADGTVIVPPSPIGTSVVGSS